MKSNIPKTEVGLSYILRFGVFFCSFVLFTGIFIGWILPSTHHGISSADISHLMNGQRFHTSGVPESFFSLKEGILALNSSAIISFGLICLVSLPILRVGITLILFLQKKDYIYVGITTIVMIVLLSSIFFGKGL